MDRRRAALIATIGTAPILALILLGLLTIGGRSGASRITSATSGPLPALTATTPPRAAQQAAACAKLLAALPVTLHGLAPRVVHTRPTDSPFVVAWGNPAVVLSCGVARPADLKPGSQSDYRFAGPANSPAYLVSASGNANVWTVVDRAPYIAVRFDGARLPGDYLPTVSAAVAKALPAVCSSNGAEPDVTKLCTRRPG